MTAVKWFNSSNCGYFDEYFVNTFVNTFLREVNTMNTLTVNNYFLKKIYSIICSIVSKSVYTCSKSIHSIHQQIESIHDSIHFVFMPVFIFWRLIKLCPKCKKCINLKKVNDSVIQNDIANGNILGALSKSIVNLEVF